MYQEISSRSESKIRELSNQVQQLQARLIDYKAQLDLKDNQIHQLNYEILQLKVQLRRISEQPYQAQSYEQYTNSTSNQYVRQNSTSNQYENRTLTPNQYANQATAYTPPQSENKRQCPICGAIGFDIKEYDDKTRIISYVPRRIYAKKYVCIKCRHEF